MADTEQPEAMTPEPADLTALTVDLLSAYFASNTISSDQLSGLIQTTHAALKDLDGSATAAVVGDEHVAAVSARKSLASPDFILSMIDGKPYKTLKRHLGSHGLTPAEYRERYKLPRDYPMVAKSYSEHRRKVASDLGLGRKVRFDKPSDTASVASATAPAARPKKGPKAKAAAAPKAQTAQLSAASDSAVKAKPARKAAAPKTAVAAHIKAAPRTTKSAAPKRKPSTAKPATEPAAS